MKHFIATLSALVTTLAVVGCKPSAQQAATGPSQKEVVGQGSPAPGQKTCLAITNGVPTSSFAAVVLLSARSGKGLCTGIFVSSTALLTAAHCLDTTANGGIALVSTGVAATQVFHPGSVGDQSAIVKQDFAVVVFPSGAAPASVKIATRRVAIGDQFTIVGYGNTVVTTGDGNTTNPNQQLFTGQNTVYAANDGGILSYGESGVKAVSAVGTHSQSGNGDSGGPVMVNGDVVGTISQGDPLSTDDINNSIIPQMGNVDLTQMTNDMKTNPNLAWDVNVNLTSDANQGYLRSLSLEGVHVDFDGTSGAGAAPASNNCGT